MCSQRSRNDRIFLNLYAIPPATNFGTNVGQNAHSQNLVLGLCYNRRRPLGTISHVNTPNEPCRLHVRASWRRCCRVPAGRPMFNPIPFEILLRQPVDPISTQMRRWFVQLTKANWETTFWLACGACCQKCRANLRACRQPKWSALRTGRGPDCARLHAAAWRKPRPNNLYN